MGPTLNPKQLSAPKLHLHEKGGWWIDEVLDFKIANFLLLQAFCVRQRQ
jgi:hypothetical protein